LAFRAPLRLATTSSYGRAITIKKTDRMSDLDAIRSSLLAAAEAADSLDAIEAVRVKALGKQSEIAALMKTLGGMSPDERQQRAPLIQALRGQVADAIGARKASLEADALDARLASEKIDMTLPVAAAPQGSIHPVSQVMDELAEIFADLGFAVATGPEIEDDWHNFSALNIPESHPARAMHDTFYLNDPSEIGGEWAKLFRPDTRKVLRTHTSPVQIRTMLAQKPPIRIIAPGRTYRSDSDATHTPMFHQVEGLVIDRGIHMGHLKWTLETFVKAYFERDDIVLRLRPSYFPFTEPSAEVDVGYTLANGRRVIGGAQPDGWMEILGSGMVHPKVIAACGLDPAEWQGFAFGCGIDRLAMLKYGMDDLRAFFDGDLRWLRHYGFAALDVPTLSGGVGA
jgi:phenylalanyl-tRNA synthetase alpha chain